MYKYKKMDNNQEIIIPPPMNFRDTSVFVKCDPTKINFREELERVYHKVIKYKGERKFKDGVNRRFKGKRYLKEKCDNNNSIFGQGSRHSNNKIELTKVYKNINNIEFDTIDKEFWGCGRGIDRCGIEVFYLRSSMKTKDGKVKQNCKVKNNGELDGGFTVKQLKDCLKMNGVKGYSKLDKKECIEKLLKL